MMTRRSVLGGIAAASTLVPGGVPLRVLAQGSTLEQVLAHPVVDLHSHAGGIVAPAASNYDLAGRMRAGRFAAVTLAVVADRPVLRRRPDGSIEAGREPQTGELFRFVEQQLTAIDALFGGGRFARVLGPGDIAAAYRAGQPALIIAVEGGDFLDGRLERVQWAFDRGVRHLQLVHYRVNELGDIQTAPARHNGLSDFGAEVVRECNRLGIIVDVAHATQAATARAAQVTRAPLVMSHGGVAANARVGGRMMTAEHAKIVIDSGGIIGLWPNGFIFQGLGQWVDYVAAMAQRLGADHVAIGTDMEGGINEVFANYAGYPKLVEALLAKNLSSADVIKIASGNHLRVFEAVKAAAAA